MSPADLPAAALAFVNQLSEMDVDVDYVTLRFDSQTKELGLTYSDGLKAALGLGSNHYMLVSPNTAGTDGTGSGGGDTYSSAHLQFMYSPFSAGLTPPMLSAPAARLAWLEVAAANPNADVVGLLVAAGGWADLYARLAAAVTTYPAFAELLPIIAARLNGTKPATLVGYKPEIARIDPVTWAGRYADVLCVLAVLVFPVGQVPEEFLT
jgi:hypothetical protein